MSIEIVTSYAIVKIGTRDWLFGVLFLRIGLVVHVRVKDFSSIRINGRCFEGDNTLKVFPGDGHRLSFVFGGNGSGKSSISNAFLMKKNGILPAGISFFAMLDSEDTPLDDEAEVLQRTHVFNERFIEEKVRVTGDGLESIVMLGEAGELTDSINEAVEKKGQLDTRLHAEEKKLESFNDHKSPFSPEYWDEKIVDALTGIGKWNDREKRIRQLQRSATVNANAIETIKQRAIPEVSRGSIERELDEGMRRNVGLSESEPLPTVPTIPNDLNQFSEEVIIELLAKKLQKPELSDREKRLFQIAEIIGTSRLSESRDYFSNSSSSYCPYCFRDMNQTEADNLVNSISLVLNEEADNHAKELSEILFPKFEMNLHAFSAVVPETVRACNHLVERINLFFDRYKELVEDKINNLFTPQLIEPLGIADAVVQLSVQLEILDIKRSEWNKAIREKSALVVHLQELNKMLARLEIDDLVTKRSESAKAKQELESRIASLREESDDKTREIDALEAQKSNIKVALDRINSALAFVFLDREHLELQGSGGEYRLLSHGANVKPQDVSTGERNAIALCYFFTLIGEGKSASDAFLDEMLLVIDDPVSSFDQENRIGMLSYLREQFKAVLRSNPYSKILCLTHDGYSMNAFDRVSEEIMNHVKREQPNKPIKKPDSFTLVDGSLSKWSLSNMRYGDMLRTMYNYSLNPDDVLRPYMGNVARRALEAFSTFEFNLGVSAFADNPEVLDRISSECRRIYFANLMFHLVLHSESHTEDLVKTEGLVETMPEYTPNTVDRIIRDTLCLIYSINDEHVLTHLAECETPKIWIEQWIAEIESTLGRSPIAQQSNAISRQ